ncbi:hypothetical protein ABW286_20655 [Erwinia papayae]|uniref:J domain-containing protein n=1 Tax=Erwinia papayae TaxID=206499 RepID=A0ABV3N6U1_9GAMM
MSKARDKIASNGFSTRELLSVRSIYRELKNVYHPELTSELTLESVILEEARKSFSIIKYYLVAVVLSALAGFFFRGYDSLFMPVGFILLILFEIRSSAKNARRTPVTELKLMKLAVRLGL